VSSAISPRDAESLALRDDLNSIGAEFRQPEIERTGPPLETLGDEKSVATGFSSLDELAELP
jgi:hypothetical protein